MKRNPSSSAWLAGLLLMAALPGCGKHEEPPPKPQPKKEQPAKPVQPAAVQKQLSSVKAAGPELDFRKRTDPFKPFAPVVEAPPAARPGQPARPQGELLPIQTYEVTRFKVVGIIAGLKQNRALLIDPGGRGYVVHEGMQIGNNQGRITKITSSGIEVIERYREDSGRYKNRKVVLTLAKKR